MYGNSDKLEGSAQFGNLCLAGSPQLWQGPYITITIVISGGFPCYIVRFSRTCQYYFLWNLSIKSVTFGRLSDINLPIGILFACWSSIVETEGPLLIATLTEPV